MRNTEYKRYAGVKSILALLLVAAAVFGLSSFASAKFIPTNAPAAAAYQPVIDKTYAELSSLATNTALVPGQQYRLTDFRTYHLIPGTADYNTGTIEPLIVSAATATQLSAQATSQKYPQDVIYYELVDSSTAGGDRGRIYFRHDTAKNISVWENWRANRYRRWNTQADGLGPWSAVSDNGNPYRDLHVFNDSAEATGCYNIQIEGLSEYGGTQELSNTVFLGTAYDSNIGTDCVSNTIGSEFFGNVIGHKFNGNSIGNNFNNNQIGHWCHINTIGDDFYGNVIGDRFDTNTVGTGFVSNIISHLFNGNTVGSDFYKNLVHGFMTQCIFGNEFMQNVIDATISNITFGTLESKTLRLGLSTMPTTTSISVTTLDITSNDSEIAGVVNITSVNAAENVDKILNQPSNFDYEIRPELDLTLTITGTAYSAVNADGRIILGAAARVLNGAKRDSIKLRKETITNGNGTFVVAREVGVNISL